MTRRFNPNLSATHIISHSAAQTARTMINGSQATGREENPKRKNKEIRRKWDRYIP